MGLAIILQAPIYRALQGEVDMTQGKKLMILLVEDEPSLLSTIQFTLKRHGYEVEGADDGLLALERLKESTRWGRPFDLMIMDIQIPLMDGLHLLEAARKEGLTTPTLVITGHGTTALKKRMEQLGIAGWLDKPFSQDELLKKIQIYSGATKAGPKKSKPRIKAGKK